MTDTEFNAKLGAILKKEREEAKVSQQTLADRLGVSKSAVSYWESGDNRLLAETLDRYCSAIGIDMMKVVRQLYDRAG